MTTDAQARQILLSVWHSYTPLAPTLARLQAVQSVVREETHYGDAFNGNWGAVQGGRPDASGQCPPGTFGHGDTHENGTAYAACFKLYANSGAAAGDVIRWIMSRPKVVAAIDSGDQIAFDTALRKAGYYELPLKQHIKATTANLKAISKALGEPLALVPGGTGSGGTSPLLQFAVTTLVVVAAGLGYRKVRQRKRAA